MLPRVLFACSWTVAFSRFLRMTERGFDFAFAATIFAGPTVEQIDDRRDYGDPAGWLSAG